MTSVTVDAEQLSLPNSRLIDHVDFHIWHGHVALP